MKKKTFLSLLCTFLAIGAPAQTLLLEDIHIRDPYIVADGKTRTYYMYGSHGHTAADGRERGGVQVYTSKDLRHWTAPQQVFTVPEDNWITGRVWAPEVHCYKGRYYLFATLNTHIKWKGDREKWAAYTYRGTQIFHAKKPTGPFRPFGRMPHTPIDQMALDGTLWVEDGQPYMVYCHEWVQIGDGSIDCMPLQKDLSQPAGMPTRLFHGSAAPWGKRNALSYVTDGCFLYRTKTGKLLMTWSSFGATGYCVGIAESTTGKVTGPWQQQETPLFTQNGGHNMTFRTFDGRLCTVLHQPNSPGGKERAHIYELQDTGETLKVIGELK
ncbi:MAG: family 43 glycosylhydrolase [Bacteroidaceae bacterium]|nr:family 43 glycosylhydrolase [Bacteroidaceae bacterium]